MKKLFLLSVFIVFIFFNHPVLSQEQLPSAGDQSIYQALEELNKSLKVLSGFVEEHLKLQKQANERQQIEIAMKRIELHNRKLAPLEKQLQDAKYEKESLQEEIKTLQVEMERIEEMIDESDQPLDESDKKMYEQEIDQLKSYLKLSNEKVSSLDLKILEMENELIEKRADIEKLENYIDENIGL